ncbi:MAG: threonine synthase [Betaproteobacteria bacterium]|nr:MAG: threonine synthase [Betaproteobacteria bacterium]
MRYVSTRGGMEPQPFSAILLEGLAPDGGLAVPESYPRFSAAELARLRPLSYRGLAFEILSRYADDIPPADLRAIIDRTYTAATFGSDEITPVTTLEPRLHLLRVANGPTLAFKDIALQLLGRLFEHVLAKDGITLNVLGATSGDTGSSAEYALRGKRGIKVFMLSPKGRMSPFQTAQMYSLADANIFNLAIEGVFDDCQDLVKAVAGDAEFKARHRLGAVNSINWARIAAQIVYYFKGYLAVARGNGEEVDFAVPSGNFGNILAGHVAKAMGLPIRRLILATNENDVLDEFFKSGRYRIRTAGETLSTSSPSMDISKASNFERFVFDLVGRDPAVVRELWVQVVRDGGFDLAGTPSERRLAESGFVSGKSTHADRLATIRHVAERFGVIVDPHTADGIKVGLERRDPGVALICIETALPAKFAATSTCCASTPRRSRRTSRRARPPDDPGCS